MAQKVGAGFILQTDSNAHLGTDVINGYVNEQNVNAKYFVQFLERMPSLTLINSLPLCEGEITIMIISLKNSFMMVNFVILTYQSIHLIKWKKKMEEMPVQEPLVMDLLI